jgi:hypothetical protein
MASRAVAEAAPRAAEPGRANRAAPIRPTSSAVVDVTSSIFAPSATVMDEIEASGSKGLDVRVIAKGLTEEGHIKVRKDRLNKFHSVGTGSMPILNPWTQQLGGMHLNFAIDDSAIQDGYASLAPKGGGKNKWLQALQNNATLLGGLGLKIESLPKPVNRFENGKLELGVTGARIVVGGYVDADFDLLLENMNKPKIKGSAKIVISGTTPQELALESDGDKLTGSVSLAVTYKSFSGAVKVVYLADGTVDVAGKAAYSADKLSGEIAFVATDLDAANKFARDAIAAAGGKENVQNAAAPAPVPVAKQGQKKRALAATGQLGFNLTKWFAGTVNVVVDGKGAITVIGKIAPPGEIILFKEKPWDKEIVKFEAKAYYGLPVVGNLNLFANISLHAIARLGPATLSKIEILGTYSTDPEIQKSIQISGSINISAYAGLRLRAEGGAGITIVKHDLKFGIGLNADVGVKAYADARPTIGYRDPGDFYISGTLDLVAQPMLGLSGEFFIELDAPWFSPIDDDRWSWPLFSKEWPLSDPIGISATLKDYVLGSGNVPEITIKPPEFDPSKFMSNMVDDKLPNKSGAAGSGQGTFKEDGSVPKPIVPPKKPVPKTAPAKPGKKGPKLAISKSGTADPKGPKERANTKTLENAAEKVVALKGKGPLTEAALDAELAKIKAAVSGVGFDKKLAGTKWSVKPKAGKKAAKAGIELAAKKSADKKDEQKVEKPEKTTDIKISLPFAMQGESHTIYAEFRNGKIIFEMASGQREQLIAKTLRAMSATQNQVAKRRLQRVYDKLKKAEEEITFLIPNNNKIDEARALAAKMTREAADQLKSIGVEFGISDLNVIPHLSIFVDSTVTGYHIKPKHHKNIRSLFYRSDYDSDTNEWRRKYIADHLDTTKKGNFIDKDKESTPITEATIDHQPRVVEHWQNLGGKTSKQAERRKWFTDFRGGHLSVVAGRKNSSDGADAKAMGLNYKPDGIGKDFRGPGEI